MAQEVKEKQEKKAETSSLSNIVDIVYLNKENTKIEVCNSFLTMTVTSPREEEKTEMEEKSYERVFLHRAFPFDDPFAYISVLDKDSKEVGLIRNLSDFGETEQQIMMEELDRKYYAPKIIKILSVKERYGFSYWKAETQSGEINFTLQDTYRNLLKVHATRIFLTDVYGNRYEIPNVEELDHASYKKIELYL